MDEVGRAVQRVDDPGVGAAFALALAAAGLFGPDAVLGVGPQQRFDDRGFGGVIDFGHEVVGLLGPDPQRVEIERSPVDEGTSGACGLDGHVEHGVEVSRHGLWARTQEELPDGSGDNGIVPVPPGLIQALLS
jgi:hypothetical protein